MESEYPPNIDELTEGPEPSGWQRWIELAVAIAVIVIAIGIMWMAMDFRQPRSVRVSPRVFPQLVGGGMLIVGIWYVIDIVRNPNRLSGGEDSEDVDLEAEANWRTLIIMGIGLMAFALLVEPLGFSLAAAILFCITSYAMGTKRYLATVAIALVLGIFVFIVFDTWLGVRLPEGILAGILP